MQYSMLHDFVHCWCDCAVLKTEDDVKLKSLPKGDRRFLHAQKLLATDAPLVHLREAHAAPAALFQLTEADSKYSKGPAHWSVPQMILSGSTLITWPDVPCMEAHWSLPQMPSMEAQPIGDDHFLIIYTEWKYRGQFVLSTNAFGTGAWYSACQNFLESPALTIFKWSDWHTLWSLIAAMPKSEWASQATTHPSHSMK